MATNINRGAQQITIYPYQEITSLNANQILYGVLQPGVSNIEVSLYSPSSNAFIGIQIKKGATFIFEQELPEGGVTRKFLVKCVLEDDVNLESFDKASFWGATYDVAQLYLYANLNYDLSSSDMRYADFSIATDKQTIYDANDLIVATLLNQKYFTKKFAANPANIDLALQQYRVSYQDQANSNIFPSLYKESIQFRPIIDGEMRSVTIPGGSFLAGNTLAEIATQTVQLPAKVTTYPSGTTNDYFQVDVLRLKINKAVPRTPTFEWESTLLAKPTSGDWTWTTSYSWTEAKLTTYLSSKALDLKDSGHILLILVRPNWAEVITDYTNRYSDWAEAGFNKIFPAICVIPKKDMLRIDEQDLHSRFKLPVYDTVDLI